MQAVVLAGGEGTRLRPLTLATPKQLLPVAEQPMIERVLGHLAGHGVDRAVLSLGYLPEAFVAAYPDGVVAGVRLSYAVEPEPLDTAGAIRFAAGQAQVDRTFVVVNGDVLTDLDLQALVAFHRRRRAEGTIALHPVADPSAFGVVATDDRGRVTAFVEKPSPEQAPTRLINAGTYVLEPSVLDRIAGGRRVSIERETFPAMVEGGRLYAREDGAYWLDAGTPATYLQAHLDLLEGRRPGSPVDGARRVAGGFWMLGRAHVAGKASSTCLVGDGAEVEAGADVDRSVVGAGCVVEAGATVVRSVLLAGARVGAGSSVSGSVLGPRSIVGKGGDIRPTSVLGHGVVVEPGAVIDGRPVPA
ncbi:MAG: sugar phosphate nucleotidyltransferase [Acidimicrobiales bacterium]